MIMEDDKFQDLQGEWTNWRLSIVNDVVAVQVFCLRTKRADGIFPWLINTVLP